MRKYAAYLVMLGLLAVAAGGCSRNVKDTSLVDASHDAADELIDHIQDDRVLSFDLSPHKPVIVASFVNIDNVQNSSRLGRMIAEQMGSRFIQHGYQVIEMKLRTNSIFIEKERGELILSRELRDISVEHDAQAVIVGTYAAASQVVYVTAKVIRTSDGVIMASHDYSLPLGPDTKSMLQSGRR